MRLDGRRATEMISRPERHDKTLKDIIRQHARDHNESLVQSTSTSFSSRTS